MASNDNGNGSGSGHDDDLTARWPAMRDVVEQMGGASGAMTLRHARSCFEREFIAIVLEQHRGRMADAAHALGIRRTNLYRKMRALNVPRRRRDNH